MEPSHKDYFSAQAGKYALFRPTYPAELYSFIFKHLHAKHHAWDCATGNGQVAQYLAGHFERVSATDISQKQLNEATKLPNVTYSISPAESTVFPGHSFDLITVGQALHWFDRVKFFKEVERVLRPDGLLAVWGYDLLYIEPEIDAFILDFYQRIVGPFWDDARRLVEDQYRTLSFPFTEIKTPGFDIETTWDIDHLGGYLGSWSATQKYINVHHEDPVPALLNKLRPYWTPVTLKSVRFPVFLRLFRL